MSATAVTAMPSPAVIVSFALPMSQEELRAQWNEALAAAAEKIAAESHANDRLITLDEAVAMTPWTRKGFKRIATKENLPFIKGLRKAPVTYKRGEVIAMLTRMQIWPKGKPPVPLMSVA